MTRRKSAWLLPLLVLPWLGACADDSYAVISVLTYSGTIEAVAQFRVNVGNGTAVDTLNYPNYPNYPNLPNYPNYPNYPNLPSRSLDLDTSHPVTFSVEFTASHMGDVSFEVEALAKDGTVLGYGKSAATLTKGKVVNVAVLLVKGTVRPEHEPDAGVTGDAGTASLSCDPYAPELACGADRTCGLLCGTNQPAVSMCYAAGASNPGDTCASNNDCGPGSQCFTFTAVGCSVMTCLRFCNHDDAGCAESGAYCNLPIPCGPSSQFQACSRPCDPTGMATTGCAPGLACFVYDKESTDCACAGLGTAGAACTQNSGCNGEAGCLGCQAGLSCVVPTGAAAGSTNGVCRPICNLSAPLCPATTTCHAFDQATRRMFGFCQ
jgi:hypothetical protein